MRFLAGVAILLFTLASFATEGAPSTTPELPPPSFYLIADYLPQALYEGERFTACLRAENATGAAAQVTVQAELAPAEGRTRRSETQLEAPQKGFAEYRKDFALEGVRRIEFSMTTPQGAVRGPVVRVLHGDEAWPKTEVRGARLVEKESGAILMPLVARVEQTDDRKFAPIRWALGVQDQSAGPPPKTAQLFLPGAWAQPAGPGETAPGFGDLVPGQSKDPVALGPFVPQGPAPILLAAGAILHGLADPVPERAVIVLPPEDLEVASDPRLYAIVLDAILARLIRAGVRQIVLAPPVKFGVPPARHEALAKEVHEAAQRHRVRALETAEWLGEALWRADAERSGVYLPRPNAEGRKKLGQTLVDLIP